MSPPPRAVFSMLRRRIESLDITLQLLEGKLKRHVSIPSSALVAVSLSCQSHHALTCHSSDRGYSFVRVRLPLSVEGLEVAAQPPPASADAQRQQAPPAHETSSR